MKKIRKRVVINAYYELEPDDTYQTTFIVSAMNTKGINQLDLAKILRVTKTAVNNWVLSKTKINFGYLYTICKELELCSNPYKIYDEIERDWKTRKQNKPVNRAKKKSSK